MGILNLQDFLLVLSMIYNNFEAFQIAFKIFSRDASLHFGVSAFFALLWGAQKLYVNLVFWHLNLV